MKYRQDLRLVLVQIRIFSEMVTLEFLYTVLNDTLILVKKKTITATSLTFDILSTLRQQCTT